MGDLIFRIKSRRESAFLDHDANLARLLADCVEEIEALKAKLEKAKKAWKKFELAEFQLSVNRSVSNQEWFNSCWREVAKIMKELEGLE